MFRKYYLIIILFAFVNISFSQVFINSRYSYRINLPKKWEIKQLPSDEEPKIVSATNDEEFSISISVRQDENYLGKLPENLGLNYFMELIKQEYKSEVNLLQSESEYVENEKILFALYTIQKDDAEFFIGQYYYINGSYLYIVQLSGRAGIYQQFEETGKGYAYTFSITGNKPGKYVKNESLGFRIAFPEGWQIFATGIPYQAFDSRNAMISLEAYESEDYKGLTISDVTFEQLFDAIRSKKTDAKIVENKSLALDNINCKFVKYKWIDKIKNFTTEVTVDHYYLIYNSRFYIIQCYAPTKDYNDYVEIFQKTVESFQYM